MFEPSLLPRRLAAALRDIEDPKLRVRLSALSDLSRLASGDDRQAVLQALERRLLEDPEAQMRALSAEALADAEASSSLPALLRALDDAQLSVRQMALVALGEVSPKQEPRVSEVVRELLGAREAELRFQALLAAARLELPQLPHMLKVALRDSDPHVRYVALRLVDEHCKPDAHPQLADAAARCLRDEDSSVRVAAALLLAPTGAADARKVWTQAINEGISLPAAVDEQALIEGAGELGLVEATVGLRRHARGTFGLVPGRFAWQARVALARLGDVAAIQQISRGLRSFSRDTRTLAVAAVGRARLPQFKPQLEQLASRGAVDAQVLELALSELA